MYLRPFVSGMLSYIPSIWRHFENACGATASSAYCYSVWLRHLAVAFEHGLTSVPKVVVELGPGASLGTGIAALMSGVDCYIALDAEPFADRSQLARMVPELAAMFRDRRPIPELPELGIPHPHPASFDFPTHIISDTLLERSAAEERLTQLIQACQTIGNSTEAPLQYFAPWSPGDLQGVSADFVFSQAVLEHVGDLEQMYSVLSNVVRGDGFMSHVIDFRSHNTSRVWNGHWQYSDWIWKHFVIAKKAGLNRAPLSLHRSLLAENGFVECWSTCIERADGIKRAALAPRFQRLSDLDLQTAEVHYIAKR